MPTVTEPTLTIPTVEWSVIRGRLQEFWDAREAPHISILAQTRAGKSFLVRHGIFPLCRWDRALIIDVKGDDPTLAGWGKPVREIPGRMHSMKRLIREDRPEDNWFRLIVHDDWVTARDQVGEALSRVYDEGDWVVYTDELRAIVEPSEPGLRLRGLWERMVLRGGSRGIASVNASQEPKWCPSSFYTQSNFYAFSRIEDDLAHKRLAEIGSAKQIIPHVKVIPRRRWLWMDNVDVSGDRYWANTKVVR